MSEYFMARNLSVLHAMPGSGGYHASDINFWDLFNEFSDAARFAADVGIDELQKEDFTPRSMGVSQRAVAFM